MQAPSEDRIFYQLQPIFQSSQWWQAALIWGGVIALLLFVVWMVRRDSRGLPLPIRWALGGLRVFVVACVVVFLVNPGQRSESRLITNSRLTVLIDTSLSMDLPEDSGDNGVASQSPRIQKVIAWASRQTPLQALQQKHHLSIYRFDENSLPWLIADLPRQSDSGNGSSQETISANPGDSQDFQNARPSSRSTTIFSFVVFAWLMALVSVVLVACWLMMWWQSKTRLASLLLSIGIHALIATLVIIGIVDLSAPDSPLYRTLLWQRDSAATQLVTGAAAATTPTAEQPPAEAVDWNDQLRPQGTASQLGAAIQFIINKERGGPLAGIVVITDGQSNSGLPVATAIAAAKNANVPLYPVGVGTTQALKNVEIAFVEAPARVLPDDEFRLKAVVKSFGFAGRQVRLTVTSVPSDQADDPAEAKQLDGEQTVDLIDDGQPVPIEFELKAEAEGQREYQVQVEILAGDVQPKDNLKRVTVDVVQRKTRVMLIAGGPSREFRFLRNQLFREKNITSDVWLQSALDGADQESNLLLKQFPETADQLAQYDCLIAFDPDWRLLSTEQTRMLERWVAEQAGGLVLIAGPVNTPEWTRRPRGDEAMDRIRDLYPVVFFNQGSARLKLGRFGGVKPFPLNFSRSGLAARFLWLGDSAAESSLTWGQFDGVFGYYAVNESKAGADVLAYFSDQSTAVGEEYPIYLANQFYGAGRVFFQASGEMWRVRRIDVDYFQDYYRQLIRWASQGRLVRDSNRGVLLTDRNRCWVGDQIRVQAILKDEQDEPLLAETVDASLVFPDGATRILQLKSVGAAIRPGTFEAVVPVDRQGNHQIILPVPNSPTADVLQAEFQAKIPDLEKIKPLRNDPLLSGMANETNGKYYLGIEQFDVPDDDPSSPVQTIVPQDQETFLTGTLNRQFQKKLMTWLLIWISFALATAWTVRRSHKLS